MVPTTDILDSHQTTRWLSGQIDCSQSNRLGGASIRPLSRAILPRSSIRCPRSTAAAATTTTTTESSPTAIVSSSSSKATSASEPTTKPTSPALIGFTQNRSCLTNSGTNTLWRRTTVFSPVFNSLKHWCVFEHVRQHNEYNFGSPKVYLLDFPFDTIRILHNSILNVKVHHIFCFKQQPTDQLSLLCLHRNHSALGIMEQHNGNTNTIVSDN
mmetsp:Transcript_1836/g.4414  ORF Transcript_1836/g.4414 Transcript_1836/m.4414 type:complete len:213 (-) Transcript_1836:76-714(-)